MSPTALKERSRTVAPEAAVKRVGLVIRVSTDRQAASDEGSLKNQLQRLRAHVDYKTSACGEEWVEVGLYELRAVSGKDALRSAEMQRLFADIAAGRVNTVACTALDRISRSVADFLRFFEVLAEHDVEFVCLKQNYDTTTPQGKLFITIMMALAQFEREQTSDRTKEATAARADRGLWNGGQLVGYDLDPDQKGKLVPNPDEVALVNFAFDTYLECGSIKETAAAVNRRGYRTKAYTSRRGQHHAGTPFGMTSVQYLLKNPAYVGKKEINKSPKARSKQTYRLTDAVWPAIVDVEKFERAQKLMAVNSRTNRNGATPVRHVYVLSGGLLHCGRCSSAMEGRSGTGRLKTKYFYYACQDDACGLKVPANELEGVVLDRLRILAQDDVLLTRIVAETNKSMARELPSLEGRRRALAKKLLAVKTQADRILSEWSAMEESAGRAFLADKLGELSRHRVELDGALAEVEDAIARARGATVEASVVRSALANMGEVYAELKPYEQKELMRLTLRRAEVNERQLTLEIYGGVGAGRSVAPNWLPGQDSNLQPIG